MSISVIKVAARYQQISGEDKEGSSHSVTERRDTRDPSPVACLRFAALGSGFGGGRAVTGKKLDNSFFLYVIIRILRERNTRTHLNI